jgi:hypothetical protein
VQPSNPSPATTEVPAGKAAEPKTIQAFAFKQELDVPVHAIGLGDPPLVAVLSNEPRVRDKRGFRELPIPAALRPKASETEVTNIFFGRDNRARIMGTRNTATGPESVYLRWLDTGWRNGREEIGRLGNSPRGGLYGILGLDDPEVVCRAGDVCIIKRISGWKTLAAGPEPRLVSVRDNTAWALDSTGVSALSPEGWNLFAGSPPFKKPNGFWSDGKLAWVAEGSQLFQFADGRWTSVASPIGTVTSLWGSAADQIFAVGEAGAALWDGKQWAVVAGAPAKLRVILGRGKDYLWIGGESGLYQVSRKSE